MMMIMMMAFGFLALLYVLGLIIESRVTDLGGHKAVFSGHLHAHIRAHLIIAWKRKTEQLGSSRCVCGTRSCGAAS